MSLHARGGIFLDIFSNFIGNFLGFLRIPQGWGGGLGDGAGTDKHGIRAHLPSGRTDGLSGLRRSSSGIPNLLGNLLWRNDARLGRGAGLSDQSLNYFDGHTTRTTFLVLPHL